MKSLHLCVVGAALCSLLTSVNFAFAQGTAFTYQGRLNDGGSPASGSYDLIFSLFSVSSGAGQVGSTLTSTATAVSNGLFAVTLDFGNQFPGANRWLEIGVRTNGGGTFMTLAPRQQLTSTPYSITASNLTGTLPATQLSGSVGNAQLANSSLTVAAGTGLSGGGAVSLGGSTTLSNTGVLSVTGNADITATPTTGAVMLGSTATDANTASTIVKRDGSGNFSAGTITLGGTLNLASPTATAGFIKSGGNPFIHAYGSFNFFAGSGAGNFTLSGSENVGIGSLALANDTTGNYNTALGTSALIQNRSGSFNTAVGDVAMPLNVSAYFNTAVGFGALYYHTNGDYNTASGLKALYSNTNGNYNTAIGATALGGNASGDNNIALGYGAGTNITIGSGNICIGNGGFAGDNSTIRLGTQGTHANAFIAGISGATASGGVAVYVTTSGQLGTLTSSARFKQDIRSMDDASDELLSLRPVTFRYKPELDAQGLPQFGLVAEEVEKVDPNLVARDAKNEVYTVRYEAVNAMLLNEFLKQHRKVEAQSAEIAVLRQKAGKVDAIEKRLKELEQTVQVLTERK